MSDTPEPLADDLGELKKHLSLHAAKLLMSKAADKLRSAGYRLLHNAKPQDHGLPHEGKGYDDVVVKYVYRAVAALEKAGWELHRRSYRQGKELVKKQTSQPYDDLPERNPNETDWSQFQPKIKQASVAWGALVELRSTLKNLTTYFAAQGGHAPTGELLKQVKTALVLLDAVIDTAEKEAQ